MKEAEYRILLRGCFTVVWTSLLQFPCFCLFYGALSFLYFVQSSCCNRLQRWTAVGIRFRGVNDLAVILFFFTFNFNMNSKIKGTKRVQVVHKSVTKFTNDVYVILPFYVSFCLHVSICVHMHMFSELC